MANTVFRKKSIDQLLQESEKNESEQHHSHGKMARVLTVRDLTLMGVAAVIGAGIFSTIGSAAYDGGPGAIFLFIITAITCGFTALCYAEFASRIPLSGSAYTYSYVTFGEVIAWIIGWALILEYAIGNIVVAISWSAYFNNILKAIGIQLPDYLTTGYHTARMAYQEALSLNQPVDQLLWSTAPKFPGGFPLIINVPAFVVVVLVTLLAYIGIHESKRTANFMVLLKIVVLVFIAIVGFWFIFSNNTMGNWSPFLPNGMSGVLKGVSAVFFAYIGFDAISTTAEECKNPQRDLPKSMLNSLVICTVIYIVTALVITGMVNYSEFKDVSDPLAYVFEKINMKKIGFIISISAVIAATSVLLVFQLGQPRIWMAMSRDGLLPKSFGKIHHRFRTPSFSTILSGALVAILVLFADDGLVTDLTSIGTLFAFVLVSGGVLLLPKIQKQPGKFSIPFINGKWIVPALYLLFVILTRERIITDIRMIGNEGYQELLFILFIILAGIITVLSFTRNYSLIPVLGVLCCMYLMIEIPAKKLVSVFRLDGIWANDLFSLRISEKQVVVFHKRKKCSVIKPDQVQQVKMFFVFLSGIT